MALAVSGAAAMVYEVAWTRRLSSWRSGLTISAAADGYLAGNEPDADANRRGNVMARQRMIVLFDQAAKLSALPVGTGNKSERLLGYFTWHADDSPPINPLGDLFKSQVWALALFAIGLVPANVAAALTAVFQANEKMEHPAAITVISTLIKAARPRNCCALASAVLSSGRPSSTVRIRSPCRRLSRAPG